MEEIKIEHAILSDIGMRRANNQDSASVQISDSPERRQRRGHLFVVADGMGAHAAGELASKMAVEQIAHHYFRQNDSDATDAMRTAVLHANNEIFRRGQQNPEFHNMGTTASALAILPEGAVIGHVGDSRVYRLRKSILEQLTFDHSLVWEMEAAGQLKGDARLSNAIPKNVITRSLGPSEEVMVDLEGPMDLHKGDTFLLCSDGLTGQVEDVEIGVILNCLEPDQAVRLLVDLANLRGGPDNITIIVARVGDDEVTSASASSAPAKRSQKSNLKIPPGLAATCGAGFLAALMFALMGSLQPAFVAAVIGVVAGIFLAIQMSKSEPPESPVAAPSHRSSKSPYRRYRCSDTTDLLKKLNGTIHALREASQEKNWNVNWADVEKLEESSQKSASDGKPKSAIKFQAEAVIATMEQLREHQRKQGNDSTIEY